MNLKRVPIIGISAAAVWVGFCAISNWRDIFVEQDFIQYAHSGQKKSYEMADKCKLKYYFIVPFSSGLEKAWHFLSPTSWCVRETIDRLNR